MSALPARGSRPKASSAVTGERRGSGHRRYRTRTATVLLLAAGFPAVALAGHPASAVAPEGAGFNLNRSDLGFILEQIKVAERHAATASPQNPCGTLRGNGSHQIPNPVLPVRAAHGRRLVQQPPSRR